MIEIKHRSTGAVIFSCDVPDEIALHLAMKYAVEKAVASRSDLRGSDLRDSNLSGSNLRDVKNDFWAVLLHARNEIPALRTALLAGKVDGSTYTGECACLVGTIANTRGCDYQRTGIKPDSSRPAELWFMGIKKGDTPDTNQVSSITVEWLDEFVSLLNPVSA